MNNTGGAQTFPLRGQNYNLMVMVEKKPITLCCIVKMQNGNSVQRSVN